jgi:hypothetical protein
MPKSLCLELRQLPRSFQRPYGAVRFCARASPVANRSIRRAMTFCAKLHSFEGPFGIGAKIAKPDKQVIVVHGDGSFGLSALESRCATTLRSWWWSASTAAGPPTHSATSPGAILATRASTRSSSKPIWKAKLKRTANWSFATSERSRAGVGRRRHARRRLHIERPVLGPGGRPVDGFQRASQPREGR